MAFLSTLPLLAGRMEGLLFLSSAALLMGTKCSGGLPFGLFVASCGKENKKDLQNLGSRKCQESTNCHGVKAEVSALLPTSNHKVTNIRGVPSSPRAACPHPKPLCRCQRSKEEGVRTPFSALLVTASPRAGPPANDCFSCSFTSLSWSSRSTRRSSFCRHCSSSKATRCSRSCSFTPDHTSAPFSG